MDGSCKKLRDRILEAGTCLIVEQGVRNTTLDLIAQRANTTKMGILRLFDSKDELIIQIFETLDRQTQQQWNKLIQEQGGGVKGIRALLSEIAKNIKMNPNSRGCPLALSSAEHNMFRNILIDSDRMDSDLIIGEQKIQKEQHSHEKSWLRLHQIAENHKKALHDCIYLALKEDNVSDIEVKSLWLVHAICGLYLNRGTYFGKQYQKDLDSMLQWIELILENTNDE